MRRRTGAPKVCASRCSSWSTPTDPAPSAAARRARPVRSFLAGARPTDRWSCLGDRRGDRAVRARVRDRVDQRWRAVRAGGLGAVVHVGRRRRRRAAAVGVRRRRRAADDGRRRARGRRSGAAAHRRRRRLLAEWLGLPVHRHPGVSWSCAVGSPGGCSTRSPCDRPGRRSWPTAPGCSASASCRWSNRCHPPRRARRRPRPPDA